MANIGRVVVRPVTKTTISAPDFTPKLNVAITDIQNVDAATRQDGDTLIYNSATGTYSVGGITGDSGSLALNVAYTDGSGVTTTTKKVITYVKTKKAAPVITFTLNNKSQTLNAQSNGVQLGDFSTITYNIQENVHSKDPI